MTEDVANNGGKGGRSKGKGRIDFGTAILGLITAVVSLAVALVSIRAAHNSSQQSATVQSHLTKTNSQVTQLQAQLGKARSEIALLKAGRATTPPSTAGLQGVLLPTLCHNPANKGEMESCGADLGNTDIGSHSFDYTAMALTDAADGNGPLLGFTSTTCQRLTLRFGFDQSEDPDTPSLRITVKVMQPSGPGEQASVGPGHIATLNVDLNKQPFTVTAESNVPPTNGDVNWQFVMTGTAMCATSTGT
jgi:hypothetical protein